MEEIKNKILFYQKNYIDTLDKLSRKYTRIEHYVSVATLKVNEDIIGFFFDTIENDYKKEEAALRLYGLLQALFVSIDSIYTLCLSLTNSKNFVRINDNKTLRELKYIRNDVVGHPTNRIILKDVVYCILDPSDILKYSFKYHIYVDGEDKIREVSFLDIILNYYIESSKLLDALYDYQEVHQTSVLSDDVEFIIKQYQQGDPINQQFRNLKNQIEKVYSKNNSRIMQKIELLQKINKLPHTILNNFSFQYQLIKLYHSISLMEHTTNKKLKLKNVPDEVKQLKKMFKNNKYASFLDILINHNNPTFNESLNKIIQIAKKENLSLARLFFEEIRKRISKEMYDEAYALEALLKLI